MIRQFTTAILLLLCVSAFSQQEAATIYFTDGSSIKGLAGIKEKKLGFLRKYIIEFRVSTEDKADEWDETMAKGVTFTSEDENRKFEYIVSGKADEPVLMEVMAEGNVNLYVDWVRITIYDSKKNAGQSDDPDTPVMRIPKLQEKDYLYVKKATEEYPTLLNGNFKKKALSYFSDCETLVKRIEDNKYPQSAILGLVEFYNDYCTE